MAQDVAVWIHDLRYEGIPDTVISVMRRSLLDTLGVAAIGSTTKIAGIVRRYAREHMSAAGDAPRARGLFSGQTLSPMGAAMSGAFTIDSIDAHDGYSKVKGHAGSGVFPAVMAVADQLRHEGRRISGREVLTALCIAYEVGYRSGLCMHATCADYHTSGAWTAVGAAAAAAHLMGLSKEQIRHAIGIAEYHGPRSQMMRCIDHPSMLRDGVGWGSPSGVSAAYLARLGFTGAPAITCEGEAADPWWHDLGQRWEVTETHYKAYPVCRWAHPALDAVRDLMRGHGLSSADIERAQINTFHYATRLAGQNASNMDELTYALAYPFAIMVVHGEIGPAQLTERIFDDDEVRRISLATEIVDDEHYTRISIEKRWADVVLFLKDGREIRSDARTPRGDPDNPLSDQEISDKFHLLADQVIGRERALAIESLVTQVTEPEFNLDVLTELIYPAA